ncbi:F-box/LRR-repeat protein 4 isoform X1 [Anopheles cruzii]|uniref:F-box/LRR-repeat protein 4 isoform X1 n=2 Tax=Anopheles cruzii TaxID=68878 RepID=UPI0022EC704C|nr:F-box/LRR-repeat protein 4 isoform X1 [Anopheles cruzii]
MSRLRKLLQQINLTEPRQQPSYVMRKDSLMYVSQEEPETSFPIKQFVSEDLEVSSQYGAHNSITYTALNLRGKTNRFPSSGDFSDTYMLAQYGRWWQEAPSFSPDFGIANLPIELNCPVDDYIVVKFEQAVYPTRVEIFETLNAGSVYRLWVYTVLKTWVLIWDRSDDTVLQNVRGEGTARIFVPCIRRINSITSILKVEFSHRHQSYYSAIDAIALYGEPPSCVSKSTAKTSIVKDSTSVVENENSTLTLSDLPQEIIYHIFKYLDLISLKQVEHVCPKFATVTKDWRLYREVNLRPYWMMADDALIDWLAERASHIEMLDLSWCGSYGGFGESHIERLLLHGGAGIKKIRINCNYHAHFVSRLIYNKGLELEEFSVANSPIEPYICSDYLWQSLQRLNVSYTNIRTRSLLGILSTSRHLRHLNVNCCTTLDMTAVLEKLGTSNLDLVSCNAFKTEPFPESSLLALRKCTKLQELDIGWSTINNEWPPLALQALVRECGSGLKKLFLGAMRGLLDDDLLTIASHCSVLEQLALVGCTNVTPAGVETVLSNCRTLRLLDVSHCMTRDCQNLATWAKLYPQIDIQCVVRTEED